MFRPGPPRDRLKLPARFGFGDVEVDVEAARARRAGATLGLEPKAFDLLLLLAANPGRMVEKQEIFERLWPEVHVTDNALSRVVAQLRRELGDPADEPRYVETVRTRGYRFLAEARALDGAPAPGAEPAAAPRASPRRPWRPLAAAAALAALVVVGVVLRRSRDAPAPRPLAPVQVTLDPAFDGQPALSPDGTTLVFVSERRGLPELWTRALLGGAERPLLERAMAAVDPSYSRDGRWIAFSTLGGGIWRVAAGGGEPRQVTDFGSRPAFSPEGGSLVFQSEQPTAVVSGVWPVSRESTLWIAELADGSLRELTPRGATVGGHAGPAWSPDGETIVFAANDTQGSGLWRVPAAGGEIVPVATGRGLLFDPVFDVDGRHLLAVRAAPGVGWSIARVALAAGSAQAIETVVPLAPQGTMSLSLSGDGSSLAYSVARSRVAIELLPVGADGALSGAPRSLLETDASWLRRPCFLAPDGSRLAMVRFRQGAMGDLLVVDLATGAVRERREILDGHVWSLANGKLGMHHKDVAGAVEIDPESGAVRRLFEGQQIPPLPAGAEVVVLRWTADLTRLVATLRQGSSYGIYTKSPGAPWPERPLVEDRHSDWAVLSPDGNRIAFETGEEHGHDLWVVGADGTGRRRLVAGGVNWTGAFSPDGSQLAYLALDDRAWNLWSIPVAGGAPRRLTSNDLFSVNYQDVTWSPRGDRLALSRARASGEVWTVRLERSR